MPQPRSHTVLVEDIPEETRTVEKLTSFFNQVFGADVVERVDFVKDTRKVLAAQKKHNLAAEKWSKAQTEEPLKDAMEQAGKEVTRLRDEVNASEVLNSTSAFVLFKDRRYSEVALKLTYTEDDGEYVVLLPPDPSDVIYEDLQVSDMSEVIWETVGYALIAGLFFGFMPIVVGISRVTRLETLENIGFVDSFVTTYPIAATIYDAVAGTLALTLFMSFLPTFFVMIFSSCFLLRSGASLQHRVQQWYFYFQVIFVLLVTAVGASLVNEVSYLAQHPFEMFAILAKTLPKATHFYLNYFPMQWVTHSMNLMRYINLAKFMIFKKVYDEETARAMSEPEDQDYYGMGSRSARWTLLLVIGLVFCCLSPLITILCFVNFALCRVFYGYLVVYAETQKVDLGGIFWCTSLKHTQQGLFLFIMVMTGVLFERSSSRGPGIISAGSMIFWLISYSRFAHKFQLDSLPLKDVGNVKASSMRLTTRGTYKQPELLEQETEGTRAGLTGTEVRASTAKLLVKAAEVT